MKLFGLSERVTLKVAAISLRLSKSAPVEGPKREPTTPCGRPVALIGVFCLLAIVWLQLVLSVRQDSLLGMKTITSVPAVCRQTINLTAQVQAELFR